MDWSQYFKQGKKDKAWEQVLVEKEEYEKGDAESKIEYSKSGKAKYPSGKAGLGVYHYYTPNIHEVWVKGYGTCEKWKTMDFPEYITASLAWVLSSDKMWDKLHIKAFSEQDKLDAEQRQEELVARLRNGTATGTALNPIKRPK